MMFLSPIIHFMVKGMQAFTGEKSRRDQWLQFVKPDDIVGLKVNGLGGKLICTK